MSAQSLCAIFFDNDGTLVDSRDAILTSFRHATKTVLGYTPSDSEMLDQVGIPLSDQMWRFTGDPAVHDELLRVYRANNHAIHDEMVTLYPGVKETLIALAERGFILAMVTSKLHELAEHGLEVLGIRPYFAAIIGADDTTLHKPDPEPLLAASKQINVPIQRCAYVGDSPFDVQASNAAGSYTIAATWGFFTEAELLPENPKIVCRHFSDLLDVTALHTASHVR